MIEVFLSSRTVTVTPDALNDFSVTRQCRDGGEEKVLEIFQRLGVGKLGGWPGPSLYVFDDVAFLETE